MTTSAAPLISSDCTRLSSSAIMLGSARRIAARFEAPKVASCEDVEPSARTSVPASRFELALGAQRSMSSCACEATVLLLASPGTPLQLATTGPTATTSILVAASVSGGTTEGGEAADTFRDVACACVFVHLCTCAAHNQAQPIQYGLQCCKSGVCRGGFMMRMRRSVQVDAPSAHDAPPARKGGAARTRAPRRRRGLAGVRVSSG